MYHLGNYECIESLKVSIIRYILPNKHNKTDTVHQKQCSTLVY